MIRDGKIDHCDVCHDEWVHEEPERERCKNRKCRSKKWNTGGQDRRTWPRRDPRLERKAAD